MIEFSPEYTGFLLGIDWGFWLFWTIFVIVIAVVVLVPFLLIPAVYTAEYPASFWTEIEPQIKKTISGD